MPKVHYCLERGCKRIVPVKQRYCTEHAKLHQPFNTVTKQEHKDYYKDYNHNKRDQKANDFYHSKQWQAVRSYVVNRDMYSSAISGNVITEGDLIVDHIIRRDLVTDPLATNNLWCLSRSEHAIKTQLEESIMKQPNGATKLKHISANWWIKAIKERTNQNGRTTD